MRTIGHQLLLSAGDDTSRVLPIQLDGNQYEISFVSVFGFEPDTLMAITNRVLTQPQRLRDYLVEVVQCSTGQVMHSFEQRSQSGQEMIPCRGRTLPEDCYHIRITSLRAATSVAPEATEDTGTGFISSIHPAMFFGIFLLMLGFIAFLNQRDIAIETSGDLMSIGKMTLDRRNMTITYGNVQTELSHKESELLALLYTFVNKPVERELILRRVWGDDGDYVGRTLDVFISRLRKKLEPDSTLKIVNIRGVGYKLVVG